MYKKLMAVVLVFMLMLLSTGCSLIWPADDRQDPPGQVPGDNDYVAGRSGSFIPASIPATGDSLRLRTVYLLDHQGRYLVPYVLSISKVEGIAKETLHRLVQSGENTQGLAGTDLQLPLPAGTTVLGLTIRDSLAIVDFSPEFLSFRDAAHERLAIDAVLYTMTEFQNVDQVEIRVSGRPLEQLPSGITLSLPITRAVRDLNLEISPSVADPANGTKVKLYFSAAGPSGEFIYFVPVTRVIPNTTDSVAAAVLELVRGPLQGSGLYADLPTNAELRSAQLIGDSACIDFSPGLLSYGGGATAEQAMLGALVLTLTEVPGVSSVKITVNGQAPNMPEGTDVSLPVMRPIFVNPFML